ncbi:MAG: RluA family pseudouridine synthase [Myxococcota bacterium]|nr:RluA family pseudouridine synthase [Myxococcota bacterium]
MASAAAQVFEFEITPRFAGKRVDQYLAHKLPELSRAYIQKLIDEGAAELEGSSARRSQRLRAGDALRFVVPETEPYEVTAEDISLDIVHEDSDLLVVNKEVGMVVHPNTHDRSGTLVNALLWHIDDLSGINGVERPGIVHRIDKNTSGLLVVAKHDRAHRHLSDQFRAHSVDRLYVMLCQGGTPVPPEGSVTTFIGRDPRDRKRMASVTPSTGKEAVTHYRVAEDYGPIAMVECSLDTGRTHQIRVHLSELGHPLVGDSTYGGTKSRWLRAAPHLHELVAPLQGQMLHAATLGFIHPVRDEYVGFKSSPPLQMMELIRALRSSVGIEPDAPGPWERDQAESFGRGAI